MFLEGDVLDVAWKDASNEREEFFFVKVKGGKFIQAHSIAGAGG